VTIRDSDRIAAGLGAAAGLPLPRDCRSLADQREYISQPYTVSNDGSVVGGDAGWLDKLAMIWTRETGMIYVADYLTMKGVTDHLTWAKLTKTVYVTPDARLMVGYGYKTYPSLSTWVVTLK
jgi:hypothetical protein